MSLWNFTLELEIYTANPWRCFKGCLDGGYEEKRHNARYSQQLQTGTGRRASFETVPPPRDRQSSGGKMSWCYGGWSRILIHGISSFTLCSEQTLSAFHYMRFIFPLSKIRYDISQMTNFCID